MKVGFHWFVSKHCCLYRLLGMALSARDNGSATTALQCRWHDSTSGAPDISQGGQLCMGDSHAWNTGTKFVLITNQLVLHILLECLFCCRFRTIRSEYEFVCESSPTKLSLLFIIFHNSVSLPIFPCVIVLEHVAETRYPGKGKGPSFIVSIKAANALAS